ncbi:hypothetical protein [Terrisporobacter mayombei]|uniref:Uncharacterized protein n=1 Tax=Terrisporobacter mayombei TaxID=1541 RepID=A0ABY9PYB6_9FIRM|nr:hypothetical protein [Terrisporobacter mayombei]MCC3868501.1 hypothetical protein [Terrisporobacter mayombei]WMT80657.1 hypothetical protein TEMA_09780 [Terrisporobacter mayombei]
MDNKRIEQAIELKSKIEELEEYLSYCPRRRTLVKEIKTKSFIRFGWYDEKKEYEIPENITKDIDMFLWKELGRLKKEYEEL